ncbi:ribosomal protein L7/L12 [Kitasatospora sp. NPDC056531]|uniref:ribosomal protein L7/L12 n=1 Tax=Kitasatospora sp. NPDC056531 TaxID=3345856 RepID=UPI00367EAA90
MEDPEFAVVLTGAAPRDAAALKAVRAVTGLSLWRSGQLLDSAPAVVRSQIPFGVAAPAARLLRRAGVPAALRCGWCRRALPDDTPVDPGPCASASWPTAHCQANSLTSCGCDFCAVYGPLPGHGSRPGP